MGNYYTVYLPTGSQSLFGYSLEAETITHAANTCSIIVRDEKGRVVAQFWGAYGWSLQG